MKACLLFTSALLIQLTAVSGLNAQSLTDYKGDAQNRGRNVMSGNKVRTTFYNYGFIGRLLGTTEPSAEWPNGSGNNYVGDVSPMVAVEYVHASGDTVHSVIACDSPRGATDTNTDGSYADFEPLPGFAALPLPDETAPVAMSNQKETWPDFWPDRMFTDPRDQLWKRDSNDPGWSNAWNGYFGKDQFSADQETYFIMDDNKDREFQTEPLKTASGADSLDAEGNLIMVTYHPVAADTSRGGIGIRMAIRGFQWAHFLAEDCIFWHYEITNISDYDYNRVAFGMVVGTLVGGDGDSEDDLAFFDPTNNITYSYDAPPGVGNPQWQGKVGYIGYAFLESPGNPYDGIDNDGDYRNSSSPVLQAPDLTTMCVTGIIYHTGDPVVVIDYDAFSDPSYYDDPMRARTVTTLPAEGLLTTIHGDTFRILPNVAYVENGHNGVDDNFNGLIDERIGAEVGGKRLDHVGHRYKNFITGEGLSDLMIDEARDDGIDNDGDWDPRTDDVGADGQAGTGDEGEGDGVPTFGEPHFDRTDINESDQIGLTSFVYFTPPGAVRMNDDNGGTLNGTGGLWGKLTPGRIDVVPNKAQDGDFLYGSGYFPLPVGKTKRFSMALLFGEDLEDITNNKETVQQIYDNNYTFVKPPDKPTVKAVPGDGRVTLYWDAVAEKSVDPSMPSGYQEDFEGYKVYRATDPGFLENYVITDGKGRKTFHKPIAQFDLNDGLKGYFQRAAFGVSFYLGDDTGLQHVWTDTTVQNGQTYYYAVTAYDKGFLGIIDTTEAVFFPAETPKVITVDAEGNLNLDQNTVVATPKTRSAGFEDATTSGAVHLTGTATGLVQSEIVDDRAVKSGISYSIVFKEVNANLISDTAYIRNADTHDTLMTVNLLNTGLERRILDTFDPYYQTAFSDPYFETWTRFRTVETMMFDGQRLYFLVPNSPGTEITPLTYWSSETQNPDSLIGFDMNIVNIGSIHFVGDKDYRNYQVIFNDDNIGYTVSASIGPISFVGAPTNCVVHDRDTGESIPFIILDNAASKDNRWDYTGENIVLFHEKTVGGVLDTVATWAISAMYSVKNGTILVPGTGDTMNISMYKPFTDQDEYVYETEAARVNPEKVDLDAIKVYPNPYLATNSQEPKSNYVSGRGERRINFIHLPNKCTIRIYNIRGELVQTIRHRGDVSNGNESWDLRSKDGLDVAYGIYIYHVYSKYGEHVGKFAVIK